MAPTSFRSRPRLWLTVGVGLTVLVVLLFQVRYYITKVMFHPKGTRDRDRWMEISPTTYTTTTRKDIELSAAAPKLKDRLSEKARVGQIKKHARKKGRLRESEQGTLVMLVLAGKAYYIDMHI